jgi:hypothetical protein
MPDQVCKTCGHSMSWHVSEHATCEKMIVVEEAFVRCGCKAFAYLDKQELKTNG